MVEGMPVGVVVTGVVVVPVADAMLVDDGDTAGCRPATATGCGVVCAEGNCGSAVRAIADVSVGASSCFHQAQRGPDWHPDITAKAAANVNARAVVVFIRWAPGVRLPAISFWVVRDRCGPFTLPSAV
jgi:hypothetical protein